MGRLEGWIAAALLAGFALVLIRPEIRGHDGVGNYAYLPSILNDGDLNFANEYRDYDASRNTPFRMSDEAISPKTELPANRYGVGAALFWAPGVVLVHFFLGAVAPDLATGYSRPYEWAVALGSAFWGALGLGLLLARLRREMDPHAAWAALALMTFATNLVFYNWMHGSMSHAVSFFAAVMAALTFEKAIAADSRPAAWLAAGFWAGVLPLIRIQDATWTLALGLAFLIFFGRGAAEGAGDVAAREEGEASEDESEEDEEADGIEGAKGDARRGFGWLAAGAGLFGLGVMFAMLPQLAAWKIIYGDWFSGPTPYFNQGHGKVESGPIYLIQTLASERGGVFAWHPILLAGLAGLAWAAARGGRGARGGWFPSRPMAAAGLVGFFAQLYLVASWSMWWGGASFGNRFFISSFPFLALGLAGVIAELRRRDWLRRIWVIAGLLIVWNLGLLVQYGTEMISREEEVGWGVVIKNQFTRVPEWVFDRL